MRRAHAQSLRRRTPDPASSSAATRLSSRSGPSGNRRSETNTRPTSPSPSRCGTQCAGTMVGQELRRGSPEVGAVAASCSRSRGWDRRTSEHRLQHLGPDPVALAVEVDAVPCQRAADRAVRLRHRRPQVDPGGTRVVRDAGVAAVQLANALGEARRSGKDAVHQERRVRRHGPDATNEVVELLRDVGRARRAAEAVQIVRADHQRDHRRMVEGGVQASRDLADRLAVDASVRRRESREPLVPLAHRRDAVAKEDDLTPHGRVGGELGAPPRLERTQRRTKQRGYRRQDPIKVHHAHRA